MGVFPNTATSKPVLAQTLTHWGITLAVESAGDYVYIPPSSTTGKKAYGFISLPICV